MNDTDNVTLVKVEFSESTNLSYAVDLAVLISQQQQQRAKLFRHYYPPQPEPTGGGGGIDELLIEIAKAAAPGFIVGLIKLVVKAVKKEKESNPTVEPEVTIRFNGLEVVIKGHSLQDERVLIKEVLTTISDEEYQLISAGYEEAIGNIALDYARVRQQLFNGG